MTLKEQKSRELLKKIGSKIFDSEDTSESFKLADEIRESLKEMFDYAIDLAAENAEMVDKKKDDVHFNWISEIKVFEGWKDDIILTISKESILQLKTKEAR